MDKTLKTVLIVIAIIALAYWLSTFLFPQENEQDILNQIDSLDTELNTEAAGRTVINDATRQNIRNRILELLEKLRKRGKKVCRRQDGTLFIADINQPCINSL